MFLHGFLFDFYVVLDKEHTGVIRTQYLREKMLNYGQKLSPQEAEEFIAFADADCDALVHAEGENISNVYIIFQKDPPMYLYTT